ncbi:TlpA disulfide reductase family protein [Paludibacter sp.]|uniref:TlpA family protein disulfide reductase n=1 Tax=Paludibacter sp. TaxID=1898105 RepID=UPI001355D494|nr:TlpA disulfide reductase family protein [Paludibacter sp.]MTK53709.1 TlpA family protein disulfide reductase [Paludibacter sp.]
MNMRKILLALFMGAIAGSLYAQSASVSSNQEPADRGYIVKLGQTAPGFTMTLTDGRTVNLWSLRGKVVMLQFTASWCGVCRKEMPFIEKDIWQRWKSNPSFALYAIDRDEPLDVAKNFTLSTGITYPMALDPGAAHFQLYADKEAGVTRNVIIDKEGKIVFMTRLYNETEFKSMVAKLEELLK